MKRAPARLNLPPSYRMLLHAALDAAEQAASSWKDWNSAYDLDTTAPASRRLFPLVHQNLSSAGVDDPQLKKLAGLRRYTWCENQLLFRQAAQVIQALEHADIPTMTLKGAPLAVLHYGDISLRPMRDFDLLVPPSQLARAMEVLRERGWTPKDPWPERELALFAHTRHAHGFSNQSKQQLDLHGYIFPQTTTAEGEACFWNGAVPVQFSDTASRSLNPADQLLHVCVHAATTLNENPVYWMADSIMILRSGLPLDAERLERMAREQALSLILREQLALLREEFPAFVPEALIERLLHAEISDTERKEFLPYRVPLSRRGLMGMAQFYLAGHRRWRLRQAGQEKRGSLLKFLQLYWQVPRLWQMPFHLAYRAGRKACRSALAHLRFGGGPCG